MSSRRIKLHWSKSKPNFGDHLSKLICEELSGREVVWARPQNCDLIAIGSILSRLRENFWNRRVDVWGTGDLSPTSPHTTRHRIHALRGRLTTSMLKNASPPALGDPGLLADSLITKHVKKKHALGIVPHYKAKDTVSSKELQKRIKNSVIIDVFDHPLDVIKAIAACEFIVSSSLHGLVVADAFGIPNLQIRFEGSGIIRGGDWKFADYYSAFDRELPQALQATNLNRIEEIEKNMVLHSAEKIADIKTTLISAFPYK